MLEGVRLLSPVLMLLAAALLASRKRLVRHFERAHAVDAARAIELPVPRPLQGWWVAKLSRERVLRAEPGQRYWLDPPAWEAYRRVRRRRAFWVFGALLLLAAFLFVYSES